MLKFYRKMQQTKSFNTIVCILDLVIIKYFGNNTIEIKRIAFTYRIYYHPLSLLSWN